MGVDRAYISGLELGLAEPDDHHVLARGAGARFGSARAAEGSHFSAASRLWAQLPTSQGIIACRTTSARFHCRTLAC